MLFNFISCKDTKNPGSYRRFRKNVMTPVLMISTNMAPTTGTMMKGFTL
jgi:hypothetical protein